MATLCAKDNEKWGCNQWVNEGKAIIEPKSSWWNGEQTAATLTKQNANGAQRMPDKDNLGAVLQPVAHAFKVRGGSEVETGEQGGIAVAQPVPFRKAKRAQSKDDHETWEQDEKTNTLNAFDVGDIRTTQAVVQPSVAGFLPTQGSRANGIGWAEEQSPTLRAGCDSYGVIQPIAVDVYNQSIDGQTAATITEAVGGSNTSGPKVAQPIAVDTYNYTTNEATTQTIRSQNDTEHIGAVLTPQQPTMAIRRLLPTECEILQGFPRGWTKIPYRNKPAEQCPDGPRYKACGNSMAVPVMRWIGQRIEMVENLLKEIS